MKTVEVSESLKKVFSLVFSCFCSNDTDKNNHCLKSVQALNKIKKKLTQVSSVKKWQTVTTNILIRNNQSMQ